MNPHFLDSSRRDRPGIPTMGGRRTGNDSHASREGAVLLAPMAPGEQEERERLHRETPNGDVEAASYQEESSGKDSLSARDTTSLESGQPSRRKKNPVAARWCVCSILLFWIATVFAYSSFWLLVIDRRVPSWESAVLLSADEVSLMQLQHPRNPRSLYCNPFNDPSCELYPSPAFDETPPPSDEAVCGVHYQWSNLFACPSQYSLQTYYSKGNAAENGAMLLHGGACGACSTTQDLAAQAQWSLSIIARNCWKRSGAMYGLRKTSIVDCIMAEASHTISPPCATLWSHFIREVMSECWRPCLFADAMRNLLNEENEVNKERYCRSCLERQTDAVGILEMFAGQSGLGIDDPHKVSVLNLKPCPNRGAFSAPRTSELTLDP